MLVYVYTGASLCSLLHSLALRFGFMWFFRTCESTCSFGVFDAAVVGCVFSWCLPRLSRSSSSCIIIIITSAIINIFYPTNQHNNYYINKKTKEHYVYNIYIYYLNNSIKFIYIYNDKYVI